MHRSSFQIVSVISLLLVLASGVAAQGGPEIRAAWSGRAAVVVWSGAPEGACVHRVRDGWPDVVVPGACGAAGQVTLQRGEDAQYVPQVDDTYVLRDERGQTELGSVRLPWRKTWLPVVTGGGSEIVRASRMRCPI